MLARDGTLLAEIFTERRTVVPIATLPAHVKLAVLAAEDAGFYEHEGLNYWGIARAMLVNLRARAHAAGRLDDHAAGREEPAARSRAHATGARSARRSSRAGSSRSSRKDEILELYLNHIYFGHGRYGIEEAARDYFGKSAKDLTIAEAAMLAGQRRRARGLLAARKHLQKALARRAFVLEQMHEKGFLSDAQYDGGEGRAGEARAAASRPKSELAPEAVEIARSARCKDLVGESAARGGYTITTTIDPTLQAAARKALRDALDAYDKRHGALGPLKPPPAPTATRRASGSRRRRRSRRSRGRPTFEQHKVLVGVVVGADDAKGTLDVRVGTVDRHRAARRLRALQPAEPLAERVRADRGRCVRV